MQIGCCTRQEETLSQITKIHRQALRSLYTDYIQLRRRRPRRRLCSVEANILQDQKGLTGHRVVGLCSVDDAKPKVGNDDTVAKNQAGCVFFNHDF